MLIREATWERIRDLFTEEEKELLNLAITGQTICPKGVVVDESALPEPLRAKLKPPAHAGDADAALQHVLVRELMGEKCPCGNRKRAKMSFCFGCYGGLPTKVKRDLYKRIGEGYEGAYRAAIEFLGLEAQA